MASIQPWQRLDPQLFLIRIATNAFRLATTAAHLAVAVAAFPAEAEGTAWCREAIAATVPRAA